MAEPGPDNVRERSAPSGPRDGLSPPEDFIGQPLTGFIGGLWEERARRSPRSGLSEFYRQAYFRNQRARALAQKTPPVSSRPSTGKRGKQRGFVRTREAEILTRGHAQTWQERATHPPDTRTQPRAEPRGTPGARPGFPGPLVIGVGGVFYPEWHHRPVIRDTKRQPQRRAIPGRRGGDPSSRAPQPYPQPEAVPARRVPPGDPLELPESEPAPGRAPPSSPPRTPPIAVPSPESLPAPPGPLPGPGNPPFPGPWMPDPYPDPSSDPYPYPRPGGDPLPRPGGLPHDFPLPRTRSRPRTRPGTRTGDRPGTRPSTPGPTTTPLPLLPLTTGAPTPAVPRFSTPRAPRLTPVNNPLLDFQAQPDRRDPTDRCNCTETQEKPRRKKSCRNPVLSRTVRGDILTTKVRLTCPSSRSKRQ